jgi:hypothetical protein
MRLRLLDKVPFKRETYLLFLSLTVAFVLFRVVQSDMLFLERLAEVVVLIAGELRVEGLRKLCQVVLRSECVVLVSG